MTKQEEHVPVEQSGSGALNYAHGETARHRSKRGSAPGILAFACILIQSPFAFFVALNAIPMPNAPPTTPQQDTVLRFVLMIPSILAFGFGCYSLGIAKFRYWNTFGLLGALLGGFVVVTAVVFGLSASTKCVMYPVYLFFLLLSRFN